jgi:hypothetical protein
MHNVSYAVRTFLRGLGAARHREIPRAWNSDSFATGFRDGAVLAWLNLQVAQEPEKALAQQRNRSRT